MRAQGSETAEVVSLAGSPHGRAVLTQATVVETEPEGKRVSAPVANRAKPSACWSSRRRAPPDAQTLADIALAREALAYIAIATRGHRLRRHRWDGAGLVCVSWVPHEWRHGASAGGGRRGAGRAGQPSLKGRMRGFMLANRPDGFGYQSQTCNVTRSGCQNPNAAPVPGAVFAQAACAAAATNVPST